MFNYKLTNLDNGLRVITAPLENTKAVTILFLFGVGSRYEDERLSGISHFLEHMFFKGTEKRPTTLDISRDLDNVGASYNAFTGEEYTGYFVRVASEHFDLGLDVLTDMIFNSKFDAKEIEREKGVIVEEINMYNDDPKAKVDLVAKELFYGNQPLGRKITGERETVTKFTRDDFVNYKKTHYTPENMVVVVAGGPNGTGKSSDDQSGWLTKIEQKFGQMTSGLTSVYEKINQKQNEPKVAVFNKETDQAHFILGFRSIERNDPKRPILKVLTNLMGQMMSSRLFIEVREKRGLCYYVHADMADFRDTGIWGVSAGVDINRIDEAIKVILEQIERIKNEPVSDEELERAGENLKGHLYLALEESFAVAEFLAERQLFWGDLVDPEQVVTEYKKVTKEDIQKMAQEIFKKENLNLAIVGPFKGQEERFKSLINL